MAYESFDEKISAREHLLRIQAHIRETARPLCKVVLDGAVCDLDAALRDALARSILAIGQSITETRGIHLELFLEIATNEAERAIPLDANDRRKKVCDFACTTFHYTFDLITSDGTKH
jgi:hypothetical protein